MSLYSELKRRNVLRVAIAYLAGAWLLIQILETLFPIYGLDETSIQIVVTILAIGFVPALVLSWVFEFTPEGIKRDKDVDRSAPATIESSKTFDRIVIAVLVVALAYFAVDKFIFDPARDAEIIETVTEQARTQALFDSYGDKSIVVLPFANMSADSGQEYFSDGLTEELLNLLSKIQELRVISRTSAFSYKGKEIDIPTVAEQLNVDHVLEGSVRKSGDKIRITAQLIDVNTDSHIWSETFDRTLDDIFVIQDEIAAEVVSQLKIRLLGDTPTAERTNPQAYALYMQARHLVGLFTKNSFITAKSLLEQALALDPDYIPAMSELANVKVQMAQLGLFPEDDAIRGARETVARILSIEPNNAGAYSWLSWLASDFDNDLPTAARYAERSVELAPTDPEIVGTAARTLRMLGRFEEMVAINEYVTSHDPLCAICFWHLGYAYRLAGRIEEAEAAVRTAIALSGKENTWSYALGNTLLLKGDAAAALSAFESMRVIVPGGSADDQQSSAILMALHDLGRQKEFDELFAKLNAELGDREPWTQAFVYAWIGEIDQAFAWLEKEIRTNQDPWWVNDPRLRSLHGDPRWQPLLATVGRSAEQLAAIPLKITLPPGVTLEGQ